MSGGDRRPAASRRKPPAGRQRGARRPAPRRPGRTGGESRLRRLVGGDRPFLAVLVVLVVAVAAMVLGPLQRYTAAADRVEALEATREELSAQVDRLEDRRATLSDPEELEIIARSELGMIMPGEVPFVVVTPEEAGAEQVVPPPSEPAPAEGGPWYRRLGRAFAGLFDAEG